MKLNDLLIADEILEIVSEEVNAIKNAAPREAADIIKLEKISKVYSTIMAHQREVLRSGVLGQINLGKDIDVDEEQDDDT
jgi:hypothetical protein